MYDNIQSWYQSNTFWDFLGIISYTLSITFVEIITLFALIIIIGLVTPKKWLGGNFVSLGSLLILDVLLVAVLVALFNELFFQLLSDNMLVFGGIFFFRYWALNKIPTYNRLTLAFLERISILAYLYIFTDIVAVMIVITRNLT